MATKSVIYHAPPVLLVLSGTLAAANWYLQPERAATWAAAVVLIVCLALVLVIVSRWKSDPTEPGAVDSIRSGIVFTGLILVTVLSTRLATALGVMENADALRRATMAMVGAFFVITGNRMPKTLTPLAALKCNPARVQAFQRFAGWTWVLTGLAFAIVWLLLPLDVAKTVSVILLVSGILVITAQLVRLRSTRRREA
jgi:hypothetical protein